MNHSKKNYLTIEANQQMKALKMIGRWRTISIGISAVGVTLAYAGFCGASSLIWMGVIGVLFVVIGFILAAIFNLGIRNGKRNVNRILNVIESEMYGQ